MYGSCPCINVLPQVILGKAHTVMSYGMTCVLRFVCSHTAHQCACMCVYAVSHGIAGVCVYVLYVCRCTKTCDCDMTHRRRAPMRRLGSGVNQL
jgi:hypothetical protein